MQAPDAYKELLWGCLASLNPGAGPAAAPRSPPRGNLRTTPHPRRMSSAIGQPSTPRSGFSKSRTAYHASLQIISQRPNPPRDLSCIAYVLRFRMYECVLLHV